MKISSIIKSIFVLIISIFFIGSKGFSQGNICQDATPFCTSVGTPYTYPNVHNGSTAPGVGTATNPAVSPFYGCICPSSSGLSNPSWFYIKSSAAGAMTYSISQVNNSSVGIDVDFVAWGPYSSINNACNNLIGTCSSNCSVSHPTCSGGIVDCSFSAAAVETMTLNATAAGQYFMIMITNYNGAAGYITFTQTGGPGSDCSIVCPGASGITMDFQTWTDYTNNSSTTVASGSTLTCTDDYLMYPHIPTGGDIVAPCINAVFSPYKSTLPGNGSLTVKEGTTSIFQFCPSGCSNGQLTGSGATAGADWGLNMFMLDTSASHSFVYCGKSGGSSNTTTVSLRNCWDNSVVYAGPQTFTLNSTSCFTLSTPAGTDIGQAYYTIAPATGSVGIYDFYSGYLYVSPTYLQGGTTYTVTYHFKSTDACGFKTSNYVFTIPATATLSSVSSLSVCSGASVPATNFTLSPSGGSSVSWDNSNTAIGVAATGTSNIGAYTAPTVTATTVGNFTVYPITSGCYGVPKKFSITINPNPTAGASVTQTLTCSNTPISLTGTGGGTYSWSGPGIVSGGATSTPTVNKAGTYTVIVTSVNGCTATANTTVSQNTVAPSPTASNTTTLTCTTTTASLTGGGGGTYSWSGPGIVSGGTTSTPTVNQPGTYTLTVTAANGCTATANTTVSQNTVAPSPTASNTTTLTCTTTTASLTGGGGGTYSWSGPGIVSGGTTSTPTVNQPGTYTVTVTAANGCTATANTTVNQNTISPTVIMPSTQTITCASPSVSLVASTSPSTSTVVWSGGVCNGTNSYTATACSPNTYTLVATDPSNGCTNTGTVDVISSSGLPSVTASNTGSITCSNTSVQVVATTTDTPVSYSWTGPSVSSGASASTATVDAGGTYTCVVTNTTTGCSSTVTTVVPTNTTPVSVSIAPSNTITCSVPSVTLNVSPNGGSYTYTWTGSGIVAGANTDSPEVNQGGSYSVIITDPVNGCTGTNSVTVPSNTVSPTLTVSPSSFTTSCASPTVQLTANASDPSVTYTWTAPSTGLIVSGVNSQSPIVNGYGEFTVAVTSTVSGCSSILSSSSTATVVPDANTPVISISPNSLTITCTNTIVTTAVTSTNTTLSYSWNPSPVSGGANPTFDTPGAYDVTVTASNGCSTFGNVSVGIDNTPPSITLTSGANDGTITCGNTSVSVNPTVTPSSGLTYTWTSGSGTGISTPVNQADATFTEAGSYTLAVTNTVTGCMSVTSGTSNVFTVYTNTVAPGISVTPISSNTVIGCANTSVTYSANVTASGNNLAYNWLPSGVSTVTNNVSSAGVYTLVVTDAVNSCSASAEYTVTGNTTPPQNVSAGSNVSMACGSSTIDLTGSSTSTNVAYSWSGPNASSIISGGNTANPTVGEQGTYTLTVTDNLTGCQSTSTVSVSQNSVSAGFIADPTSGVAPLTVNFTNQSTGATGYSWTFGDTNNNTSSNTDPSHIYQSSGTYTVELIATAGPCSDTAYAIIVVEDGLSLTVPNVFTPNGDGINDIFMIHATGVKEISLQIFNRWGQKLYSFTGPNAAWDGIDQNGHKATDGTYFFFVKATGFDGKEIEKNGTVNLYR